MSLSHGRHSGVLVPLFSMPSSASWGIGEIGDIPEMAAWLRQAGQDMLQLLPINEMAVGQRSPYSAMTAMAIDPIFISVHGIAEFLDLGGEAAMDEAWRQRLADARWSPTIDYALVRSVKEPALEAAFEEFARRHWRAGSPRADAFRRWTEDQSWWLDDYALFRALHASQRERAWTEWPDPLRLRDADALAGARAEFADEIRFRQWLQWVADAQWRDAKRRASPVSLFGDLAFMVDGDSADVWANADAFRLDASVGAPPDAFSVHGQEWGMPACRWDVMAAGDFRWLRDRARRSTELYDGFRVDHLVGFYRTYTFSHDGAPAFFSPAEPEAQLRLGEAVLGVFGERGARILAEDLGTVPDFVRDSLARLGVPGCKVFRWERHWHEVGQPYRDPASYPAASMATSGTHDTETMAAWWDGLEIPERLTVLETPGIVERVAGRAGFEEAFSPPLRDALLEVLFASGSDFVLLPIQDLFGWRDRINVPATQGEHNWSWRLPWSVDMLPDRDEARNRATTLRDWCERYGRA